MTQSPDKLVYRNNNSGKLIFRQNNGNSKIIKFGEDDNIKLAKKSGK